MSQYDFDVIIVGGGPSGSSTALHLARKYGVDAKKILLLDCSVFPRNKACGGGLTPYAFEILRDLDLTYCGPSFQVKKVVSDSMFPFRTLYSGTSDFIFTTILRQEFDHWLLEQARKNGVEVKTGCRVMNIKPLKHKVRVVTQKGETLHCKVLVGADGSNSIVMRQCFPQNRDRPATAMEIEDPDIERYRHLFTNQSAKILFDIDGGYSWFFPANRRDGQFVNIGTGCLDDGSNSTSVLAKHLSTLSGKKVSSLSSFGFKAWTIKFFSKKKQLSRDRILLVGDAAGVDPFLGEGISFALAYGRVAASEISLALAQRDFQFSQYQSSVLGDSILGHLVTRALAAKTLNHNLSLKKHFLNAFRPVSKWFSTFNSEKLGTLLLNPVFLRNRILGKF